MPRPPFFRASRQLRQWAGLKIYATIWKSGWITMREGKDGVLSNPHMLLRMRYRVHSGFTLIELLCVITIITVLAGLVATPAARALKRARAMKWGQDSEIQLQATVGQLRAHFAGKKDFPLVTLALLESGNLMGPIQLNFLKDRRVKFVPFAGTDSNDKIVIEVKVDSGFLTEARVMIVTKERITSPPE